MIYFCLKLVYYTSRGGKGEKTFVAPPVIELRNKNCQLVNKTGFTMYDDSVLLSMRFPQKLWRIVNECKTGAIRWSFNGGTILLDYKKFQEEYLNALNSIFKTNNITSFIRQLNLYGFRKVTSHNRDPVCNSHNPDVHEFLHENFRANRTDLLTKVCRRTGGGKIKFCERIRAKNSLKREIMDKQIPRISRLQMCQFALTEALRQATREYHRERFWEEAINDDPLAEIGNFQEICMNGMWSANDGIKPRI